MATRDRLLQFLDSNRGTYYSGEQMAQALGLSRAAVWKAIKSLQEEGYPISAVSNRGYCMSEKADFLSEQGILRYAGEAGRKLKITVYPSLDSTNRSLRELAEEGAPEGTVIFAEEQKKGRGRYGRQFFSPSDTGIYFSILLRPEGWSAKEAWKLTTLAACSVCRAVEKLTGRQPGIKWVNDIYLDGRKICGILTEGVSGMETGLLEYVVLGIGLNLYPPMDGFPEELQETAGTVFKTSRADMKNQLAGSVLEDFVDGYQRQNFEDQIRDYRSRSLVIGRNVSVISRTENRTAYVHGIDEEGRLLVEYENGTCAALSSGEISVRL